MARGEQIYTYRELAGLQEVYAHHGIDCGDGTVIHYSKRGEVPTISRTSWAAFAPNGRVFVQPPAATSFIAEQVVRRAESRLGERKYNLLFNNCEHFATWCKTGKSRSAQVAGILPGLEAIDPTLLDRELHAALQNDIGDPARDLPVMVDRALADIKQSWDDIQPQYNQQVAQVREWDRVAREAVRRGRDDLARRAIARKQSAKEQASRYKDHLDRLAVLTETLLRNRPT